MPQNIFLAFANSEISPLPTLSKEDDEIYAMLLADSKENGYDIIRESRATPELINQRFALYGQDIAVFHFSGHAGSSELYFGDQIVHKEGLAYHLRESARNGVLKLVVLNGCSTAGQVQLLLDLGVPAVIATNAPVGDRTATEFSTRFYYNLTKGSMDINQAFLNAMVYAQTLSSVSMNLKEKQIRGPVFLKDKNPGEVLWEIFAIQPTDASLNPLPKQTLTMQGDYQPNQVLREAICRTLIKNKNPIFTALSDDIKKGFTVGKRDIEDKMVNVVPMPIGEHLRKLFCAVTEGGDSYGTVNIKRLEQICTLYYTTMELLSIMVICQIWDNKKKYGLPPHIADLLRQHFYLNIAARATFGYAGFLKQLLSFWVTQPLEDRFLPELEEFHELLEGAPSHDKPTMLEVCEFLENLRGRLFNGQPVPANEISNLCIDAEEWLASLLGSLGFLHQYHMTSVQSISILNYRHAQRPSYTHSVVKLMRVNGSERFLYEIDDLLSCQGIVLIKGTLIQQGIGGQQIRFIASPGLKHLNLSPFLFDAIAGELGDKSQIAIFSEAIDGRCAYRFKDITKPENPRGFIDLDELSKFSNVKKELDFYQWDILQNDKFNDTYGRHTA